MNQPASDNGCFFVFSRVSSVGGFIANLLRDPICFLIGKH